MVIAQWIPQTFFFAVIFWSKVTELIPAPIFAVFFNFSSSRTDLCKKRPPRAQITELIPVGIFRGNVAVTKLPNEFPEAIFEPGI